MILALHGAGHVVNHVNFRPPLLAINEDKVVFPPIALELAILFIGLQRSSVGLEHFFVLRSIDKSIVHIR